MTASEIDRDQRSFEAVPNSARAARQYVSDALRAYGAGPVVVADYALVVSELATNIIEHGDGPTLTVFLDLTNPDWWEVEVAGGSPVTPQRLLEPDTWQVASSDQASGRGLGIVRHLMDEIAAGTNKGLFSIRCRRRREPA